MKSVYLYTTKFSRPDRKPRMTTESSGPRDELADYVATQYDRFQDALELLEKDDKYLNYGYTTHRAQTYEERQEALCRLVFDAARVAPEHHVVDVGFGSGAQDLLWARSAEFARLTGFNISSNQVAYATHQAALHGFQDRLRFVHGAAEDLPGLDAACADRLLAVECTFYFRRDDFYRRAAEVLRPGGRLVAADISFNGIARPLLAARPDLRRVGTLESNRALWERHFETEEVRPIHRQVRPGVQMTVSRILRTVPKSGFAKDVRRQWWSMAFWSQLVALGLMTRILRYDLVVLRRR